MRDKRWLWIALPAAVLVVAVVSAASSGSGSHDTTTPAAAPRHESSARASTPTRATAPQLRAVSAQAIGSLSAEVQDAAVAPLGGHRLVLLGGLDAVGASTADITTIDGASAASHGTLPNAQHDAQAATLGRYVYVFGGGEFTTYDHILRYDPATGSVAQVGALPRPASDVAVAALGGTAYIVGGFDGTDFLDTIVAWRPGGDARTVGHLPTGVRYSAVTANGDSLIIAGGTVPSGVSEDIFRFVPANGTLARIGRLPAPLTHASAAMLDGRVLIVGGRHLVSGDQTEAILAIDPRTGFVRRVGHLPRPLSDTAVATIGSRVIAAGGENAGAAQATILALTASP